MVCYGCYDPIDFLSLYYVVRSVIRNFNLNVMLFMPKTNNRNTYRTGTKQLVQNLEQHRRLCTAFACVGARNGAWVNIKSGKKYVYVREEGYKEREREKNAGRRHDKETRKHC